MKLPAFLTRKITWGILIALLATVGLWRCSGSGEAPKFVTSPVSRGEVISRVSASGSLSAVVTVEVGSQVSGRIQSLFADFNSVVKRGELIAKIDPSLFEAAVEQANANVIAARGNVERLQVQSVEAARLARRSAQLFEQGIVAENDRDSSSANARAAEAAVQQAEGQLSQALAALRQAQTNLRYTDILAPTDGIVISRAVNVGQTVAASLQAPVIFTIAQDLRAMEVHTNIAESDIGRLRSGMAATFGVDAYPTERFRGSIREIRNAPQVVQNVVTYDAVIDVANPELKLKPGMTATVSIVTDQRQDVLRVPNAALRFRPTLEGAAGAGPPAAGPGAMRGAGAGMRGAAERGGDPTQRTLFVLERGQAQPKQVSIGLSDGGFTEITGGDLKEGELVITGLEGGAQGGPGRGRNQFRIL